jgi:hypothetical protein
MTSSAATAARVSTFLPCGVAPKYRPSGWLSLRPGRILRLWTPNLARRCSDYKLDERYMGYSVQAELSLRVTAKAITAKCIRRQYGG